MQVSTYLKNFDWILLAAIVLLACFGLVEIYSIALGQSNPDLLQFKKQIFFVGIGLAAMFMLSFIDYYNLRSFSIYLYAAGVLMLFGVLLFGKTIRGTTGWFEFMGLTLQPAEFAKLILIIFLARYFSGVSIKISPVKHLLLSGLGSLVLIVLILKQPDFGSAAILFLLWLAMITLAGFRKKHIIAICLILTLSLGAGWVFFFEPYQKQRILTFVNPGKDSLDEDYNIIQATIAVGSGRVMGRGIGFGSQSQLKFLPEAQNDFIFAVIAEELGFLGVCLVIFLYSAFFYRIISNIKRVNNDFGIYVLLGIIVLIFIEMFINIGMNIGIVPVVGISLPFVSYGGSAIIASLMMVGIAEGIIIRSKIKY
ncbi:rod shape-determining protein RodA [Candidatus Falkowbacteria bacterium RIFOXYB2_FULL_47_14]|uniref:Rod shape-determining protein RodA n=1 Tax=Candidatus Falkowbacteria bacterium RIFOXYA2_FULL_47_19 TaxID=1797994 RepID=A0A1F5SLH2_9BACT|nr:MAG: rod shape-determining protein RodA [Candidatus Falkowbacteria bacterium RIFOXYA2_FULL_47_19]OGF34772.1 MAG: rod shape-determining protein RodA [Candidatus Falkowbacteria bacterium RIFOXYC2_FULL_46_15]OGF43462.1 MAG: rod shape-determining protein RodA [Candidatus Falkowbacteria bacterium RIFOXYB2_FULL_47_14]